MKDLFIFIGADAPQKVCWAERSEGGVVTVSQCGLAEIAGRMPGHKRTIVLVPGADVLLSEVDMPSGSVKRALAAIPFAMEENLASDVETIHFSFGAPDRRKKIAVAAAASEKVAEWLKMLREAELEPDIMIPTTLALPLDDHLCTVVAGESEVLVRSGLWRGYSADPENLLFMLELEKNRAPLEGVRPQITFYQCGTHALDFAELAADIHEKEVRQLGGCEKMLAVLAASFDEQKIVNLLQGPFSRHAEWGRVWAKWKTAAIAAMVCLTLGLVSFTMNYYTLAAKSRMLSGLIEDVYLKTFPGAKKIVNPRVQMEQKLALLRGGGEKGRGFLDILEVAGPGLMGTQGFKLQGIRYLDGRLDLEFEIMNLQILDDLKARMTAAGLAVDIKTATSEGDSVHARMQIKAGA